MERGHVIEGLTPAEERLLEHVRAGMLDAEIAVRMGVPIGEVKDRLASLMRKAGASERAELLGGATVGPKVAAESPGDAPESAPAVVAAAPGRRGGREWLITGAAATMAAVCFGLATFALLREDGAGEAVSPGESATTTETPGATATAPAGDATAVRTPPVTTALTAAPPVKIDLGQALFVVERCDACAPEGRSQLRRTWHGPNGDLQELLLFAAPERTAIESVLVSPGGTTIVIALCQDFACATKSVEGRTPLLRSVDGGITWTEEGTLEGNYSVVDLTDVGVLVQGVDSSGATAFGSWIWQAKALQRLEAAFDGATATGDFLWLPKTGDAVLRVTGEELIRPGDFQAMVLWDGGMVRDSVWVEWRRLRSEGPERGIGVKFGDGRRVAWWLPDDEETDVAGAAGDGLLLASDSGVPALIDPALGTVAELVLKSDGRGVVRTPVALPAGAFVMVTGAGDCLNVRVNPRVGEEVLGCYKDNTLLPWRTDLPVQEATAEDARAWYPVTTPDGRAGWAAAEFIAAP
ncbi:MAG: hypothetical protein IT303_16670 [Dehalococcoidia bacterium]|nr:hypothetical protein [Dehalococcoidia bacterium]